MKSWHQWSVALGVASVLLLGAQACPASAAARPQFTDLQYAKWASDGIYYLAERGTVAGYGGGLFKPSNKITRAQAVTYLVRELYPDASPSESAQTRYPDVPMTHAFYREITVAAEQGLIGGFLDGTFRPDQPVSRAETAALLTRAYALSQGDRESALPDIQTHWAAGPIQALVSNDLAGGYPDGTFKPNQSVTRAEYAVFLSRVIQHTRAQAIAADDWDALLSLMTVEEKVGQMLMPDIRQSAKAVNPALASTVQDHKLGGLILFEKNIADVEQLTTFTDQLQKLVGDIPLFLSIDQEGGTVKRIPGGANLPGAMALGAAGDAALALEAGKVTGAELKALGVNVDFAPVLDVNVNPANPGIGIRSFGSDAGLVAELGTAFMKGLQQEGIAATAKHFPGHGDTEVDSHLGLPVVGHDRERLEQVELKPFREAIRQGVDMIMTGHVAFPAVEQETVISKKDSSRVVLPATLSKKVVTGLLREELGFQGVVVSDAFTMQGVAEHFGEADAAVRAVAAGVDIILMPQNTSNVFDAVVQAVKEGQLEERQLDASVKRILQLKHKYGLFEPSAALQAKLANAKQTIGSDAHLAVERKIAEAAVTVLRSKGGELPRLTLKKGTIAVVAPTAALAKQMESRLRELGLPQQVAITTAAQGATASKELAAMIAKADYVIAATNYYRIAPSLYDWQGYQSIIDQLNANAKPYVLLSLGNPYEPLYLRDVRHAIAVYGAVEPNITAGLKVILGLAEARGKLPVDL